MVVRETGAQLTATNCIHEHSCPFSALVQVVQLPSLRLEWTRATATLSPMDSNSSCFRRQSGESWQQCEVSQSPGSGFEWRRHTRSAGRRAAAGVASESLRIELTSIVGLASCHFVDTRHCQRADTVAGQPRTHACTRLCAAIHRDPLRVGSIEPPAGRFESSSGSSLSLCRVTASSND